MGVKYLKGEIMKSINTGQQQRVIDENDVLFVMTVPALWDDRAKLLMREAAVEVGGRGIGMGFVTNDSPHPLG